MKRKVVCVFGDFEEKDFVLEPVVEGVDYKEMKCETFWIERIEDKKD